MNRSLVLAALVAIAAAGCGGGTVVDGGRDASVDAADAGVADGPADALRTLSECRATSKADCDMNGDCGWLRPATCRPLTWEYEGCFALQCGADALGRCPPDFDCVDYYSSLQKQLPWCPGHWEVCRPRDQ